MVKGETFNLASPCGVNCSYVMEFEGPWLYCENSTTTAFYNQSGYKNENYFTIYSGTWTDPRTAFITQSVYNGTYSIANFNSSTLTPIAYNNDNQSILVQEDYLLCVPARAKFTVNNTYINNVQSRTVSVEPISRLVNLEPLT